MDRSIGMEEGDDLDEIGKRIKREMEASPKKMRSSKNKTGVVNTMTPCAACKLLRRRCGEECPFCPYFSPHEPQKFAAVHKVFGASNVSKMLQEVGERQRGDTANSLVYEANVRLRDPIYGCMGAISALQRQVQALEAQLDAIRAEIFKIKYRDPTPTPTLLHHHQPPVTPPPSTTTAPFSSISTFH